jgi:hypothetical protein
MFGKKHAHRASGDGDEGGKVRLEAVFPFFLEAEALVPRRGVRGIGDVQDGDDLFVHWFKLLGILRDEDATWSTAPA